MNFLKNSKTTFLAIMIVFPLASFISSCNPFSDSLLIKIIDHSKCELNQYSIEMPEMTVSFSVAQLAQLKAEKMGGIVLDIPIARESADVFQYKIRAEYKNCAALISQERSVKRGYVVYEYISENKIDYAIRSK